MGLINAISNHMIKSRQALVEGPEDTRPHIVLLGAGASRAAFPMGDGGGRRLPVMNDLIEVVGLDPLLPKSSVDASSASNFELIYSKLLGNPSNHKKVQAIEHCIDTYFMALSLPPRATIYDRLVLSLRPKDAIFTFNWDPFLFDAYERNYSSVKLPSIYFLHGNVRIGACAEHSWGMRGGACLTCGKPYVDVPLFYPIEKKNYANDPYTRQSWECARALFSSAFTLTLFGYGAPTSDADAVELLRLAWTNRSKRTFEHIEIIDIVDQSTLHNRWSQFAPTHHYQVHNNFDQSRISRWPRRTAESLFYPMTEGMPCEDFPLPATDDLKELQEFAASIALHENE